MCVAIPTGGYCIVCAIDYLQIMLEVQLHTGGHDPTDVQLSQCGCIELQELARSDIEALEH